MAEVRDVADVFRRVDDLMATVRLGVQMVGGASPAMRGPGYLNVATFGRSVTLALQNLRTVVDREKFDEWYAPYVAKMDADPVFQLFKRLRNEALKEGPDGLRGVIRGPGTLSARTIPQNPPPGATQWFMGDRFGGTGWIIPQPDGTEEVFYTEPLPGAPIPDVVFEDAELHKRPAIDVCREYEEKLGAIVSEARAYWRDSTS